jgi:hypothetical protein
VAVGMGEAPFGVWRRGPVPAGLPLGGVDALHSEDEATRRFVQQQPRIFDVPSDRVEMQTRPGKTSELGVYLAKLTSRSAVSISSKALSLSARLV